MPARYLLYFLRLIESTWASKATGTTFKAITGKVLRDLRVPLAPRAEQDRIVEAIDTHLSRLDAGVAALERLQAKVERYRAAVLKAACEGTLLPPDEVARIRQSPDYEPADELLKRILKERRKRWEEEQRAKGKDPAKVKYDEPQRPEADDLITLPVGWIWATLEQLAEQRLGKMLDKEKNRGTPRPYLRNLNVRWFGFDLSDVKTIRVTDDELGNVSVQAGDLVVCEGGEPGRAGVWGRSQRPMVVQKALHRVRPAKGVSSYYLAVRLAADSIFGRLEKYYTGSTIKHFTGRSLRSYVLPLPPSCEQDCIVAEVENRLLAIDMLSVAIYNNLKRAERLRQSILRQAFSGRLVPQDSNDEPASELLKRIKASRQHPASDDTRRGNYKQEKLPNV